jgi:hypothetical protein
LFTKQAVLFSSTSLNAIIYLQKFTRISQQIPTKQYMQCVQSTCLTVRGRVHQWFIDQFCFSTSHYNILPWYKNCTKHSHTAVNTVLVVIRSSNH